MAIPILESEKWPDLPFRRYVPGKELVPRREISLRNPSSERTAAEKVARSVYPLEVTTLAIAETRSDARLASPLPILSALVTLAGTVLNFVASLPRARLRWPYR